MQERTREKQRAEKLLEDTQIKLSATISDIFGVSGRAMLEALIAGQRDPKVLTQTCPEGDAARDVHESSAHSGCWPPPVNWKDQILDLRTNQTPRHLDAAHAGDAERGACAEKEGPLRTRPGRAGGLG
ncbi:hypothetical protein [Actinomadura sp. SCN-SB]|uniref:hypothetical protein n=1 Tax=Actinomadura sp. SCN-SB TaxID=3373092 RepID=UPI003751464F